MATTVQPTATTTSTTATSADRFISAGKVSVSKLIEGVGYQSTIDPKQISKVEVFDVDMVLFMQDGSRVIIAGGAIEAQSGNAPQLLTASGPIELSQLLNQVGQIDIQKTPAPILASAIVVNASQQDIRREPFANNPASEAEPNDTRGSERANPTEGTVNTKAIETVTQAFRSGQEASKNLQKEVLQQIEQADSPKISDTLAQSSSPPILTGVPQVVAGNLDGVKLAVAAANVGGVAVTPGSGGSIFLGGMGTSQSITDTNTSAQAQRLTINATGSADEIDAMGQFASGTNASGLAFERTLKLSFQGAQAIDSLQLTGLPADVTIKSGQGTFDATTNVWTIDPSRVTLSNSGTVSNIDINLVYDPDTVSGFSLTLTAAGKNLGRTFTDFTETINVVPRKVASAEDFAVAGDATALVLPTNTIGADIVAGAGDDVASGTRGNDLINGGAGADTLTSGGAGNDTFVIDDANDIARGSASGSNLVLVEGNAANDVDNFSLGAANISGIDNATLNASAIVANLKGNANANQLTGNNQSNVLEGIQNSGLNAVDTLVGGGGDDTYIVRSGDVVTEAANEGIDWVVIESTVNNSINFSLRDQAANVENLQITGTGGNGTGSDQANLIMGNAGANRLDGVTNATGVTGADTLVGGAGADTYVINSDTDVFVELANEGTDTIFVNNLNLGAESFGINLTTGTQANPNKYANIENITLNPATLGDFDLTGTANRNVLTGNRGNNKIDGNGGVDNLIGGGGIDTFVVHDSSTTVSNAGGVAGVAGSVVQARTNYSLQGTGVNRLELVDEDGLTVNENATGSAQADVLIGNRNANLLEGGTGADTLVGGAGNDIYSVDNVADTVIERAEARNPITGVVSFTGGDTGGTDLVRSSVTHTLADFVENLELVGTANLNGIGNSGANLITGNGGNNVLYGVANAAGAIDTLIGGTGNDTYVVNPGDVVTEAAGAGLDTTIALGASYTITANIEDAALLDGSFTLGGISLSGLGRTLAGNNDSNTLSVLGSGARTNVHTISGGGGNDTYILQNENDIVNEGTSNGIDLVVMDRGTDLTRFTLAENVENLLTRGTGNATLVGNASANQITGNVGNDSLVGGANGSGGDTLIGGDGNDTYMVSNVGDIVTETESGGVDTVQTAANYTLGNSLENLVSISTAAGITLTGNSLNNRLVGSIAASDVLIGGGGNDTFDGGGGADQYNGGTDNDLYLVRNASTTINAGGGNDSVLAFASFTTSDAAIVQLQADGTAINNVVAALDIANTGSGNSTLIGNSAVNRIEGGSGNNLLQDAAIDLANPATFDQRSAADNLIGGGGNDTYIVTNQGVTLNDTSGVETVIAFSSLDFTAARVSGTFENVQLRGQDGASNLQITANSGMTIDDLIVGGSNKLVDVNGNNVLRGGSGNDTYVLQTTSSTIVEAANEGRDTVQISGVVNSHTLGANIENLDSLQATAAVTLTGNGLDNTISLTTGSAANAATRIDGGAGIDTVEINDVGAAFNLNTLISGSTSKLANVEAFNLKNGSIELLTLSGQDIARIVGSPTQALTVRLDSNDTLNITDAAANFTRTTNAGVDSYVFFTDSTQSTRLAELTVTTV